MKTVKAKLFLSYVGGIFIILSLVAIAAVYFFDINQRANISKMLYSTLAQIQTHILEDKSLEKIDENIELHSQFLIIVQDDEVAFTSQSSHSTQKILQKLDFYDDDFYEEFHEMLEEQEHEGLIYADEYVFVVDEFEQNGDIKVFLGVNQQYFNKSMELIYTSIILFILFIFTALCVIGYFLISRTIKPLKLILEEVETLQNKPDLSQRLQEIKTDDEFEKLIISFNKMLERIENSVENIKQFSSDASHELRTPLTIIQGEIELLDLENCSLKELKSAIVKIDSEQKKLQEIIKNFLLLSRLEKEISSANTSFLDVCILEVVEKNLLAIESKNLELILDVDNELEVKFDEKYLYIVLENLLTNAIKYTHQGYIKIEAKKDKDVIALKVEDSGVGLKEDEIDKVFERFYRVDYARSDMKEGLGLGLSIVKKICDKFSCALHVSSKFGKGSCFALYFKT